MTFSTRFASIAVAALAFGVLMLPNRVSAADKAPAQVQFRDGTFSPAQVTIDARQPLTISVVNMGLTPIEFESFDLNRERVVAPGQAITVYLPALQPGTYKFFDDFHHDAGEGVLTAK